MNTAIKATVPISDSAAKILEKMIFDFDRSQAARFKKLNGATRDIAAVGIVRHLRSCQRMNVPPDASAVREIIDDALSGRRVWAMTGDDRKKF